jgi:hypothetical protein
MGMPKTTTEKLTDLVTAVRRLPDESQAALVEEFADRLSDFTDSKLSEQQRDEVGRRLANPRYADPDRVREFFARFGARSE